MEARREPSVTLRSGIPLGAERASCRAGAGQNKERKLGPLGSGPWGSRLPKDARPTEPKSCDTCDGFLIDHLLKRGGPKTLQTIFKPLNRLP